MIGIICAMAEELTEIMAYIKNPRECQVGGSKFVKGDISGIECIMTLCGIGKVNAAMCTQSMIMKYNPELILNVGVAGGISPDVKIGDVIVADGVIQHDFDLSAFSNRKKGEIPNINLVEIPTTKWITNKTLSCSANTGGCQLHSGTILSGDQFINSSQKLTELRNEFGGVACEMEAGSIAQVCHINKKDFAILRSISDNADNSSNIDFDKFIKTASENAATILSNFIKSYRD